MSKRMLVEDPRSGEMEDTQMQPALEINFAMWGMIVCAAIGAIQYFDFVF